jgi:hypothetical protein
MYRVRTRSSSYPRDNGDLEEEMTRDNIFAPCIPSLTDDVPYFYAIDNRGDYKYRQAERSYMVTSSSFACWESTYAVDIPGQT